MFIFGHPAVIQLQMCSCVRNFIKIDLFLVEIWRYGDFTICNMAAVRHLEFSQFRVYRTSRDIYRLYLPCAKFHWNRTIGCWVMAL